MSNLNQINQELFALRQQGRYDDALKFYKERVNQTFPNHEIAQADQLVANVVFCLRKKELYLQALSFISQTLQLQPQWTQHPFTCFEMGWCMYYATRQTNAHELARNIPHPIAEAARFLPTINPKTHYLLFWMLFNELSKKLMQKGPAVQLLYSLFEKLDQNSFQTETKPETSSPNNPVKSTEKIPDRETFMVRKAKAALLSNNPQDCIKICNHAMETTARFHHGNHLWLARTLAMALMQQGKPKQAIEEMTRILKKKKDWFLVHEMAQMYYQVNDVTNTKECLANAFLQQGLLPYKVGLFEQMATRYAHLFSPELRTRMVWLAIKTRTEKGWKTPQQLTELIARENLTEPQESSAQLYAIITHELKKLIKQHTTGSSAGHTNGTITRILHEGENGDGFITTETGKSVYFRMKKIKGGHKHCTLGAKVKVMATEREYNNKKVYNAIWVQIIR